jgi:hypothetical protein
VLEENTNKIANDSTFSPSRMTMEEEENNNTASSKVYDGKSIREENKTKDKERKKIFFCANVSCEIEIFFQLFFYD